MTKKHTLFVAILIFISSCGGSTGTTDRCKGACTANEKCVSTIVETTDPNQCLFGPPCLKGAYVCSAKSKLVSEDAAVLSEDEADELFVDDN